MGSTLDGNAGAVFMMIQFRCLVLNLHGSVGLVRSVPTLLSVRL
jgi:hypothetical protein